MTVTREIFKKKCENCIHFNSKSLQDKTQHHCLKRLKACAEFGCPCYNKDDKEKHNGCIAYIVVRKNTISNEMQNIIVCESERDALNYIRQHHEAKSIWEYDYLPINYMFATKE